MKTVNANGMEQIHAFLAANHKLGGEHFDISMLRAWVADAEFQLAEGNPASIEIHSRDSITGRTVTFDISAAGLSDDNVSSN